MWKNFLLVAAGGAMGSMLRYSFSVLASYLQWSALAATFASNILGSALIGFIMSVCNNNSLFLLGTVGVCGGFTTFSTFSAQTFAYLQAGQYDWALGYAVFSIVTCVLAVGAGMYIGKLFL